MFRIRVGTLRQISRKFCNEFQIYRPRAHSIHFDMEIYLVKNDAFDAWLFEQQENVYEPDWERISEALSLDLPIFRKAHLFEDKKLMELIMDFLEEEGYAPNERGILEKNTDICTYEISMYHVNGGFRLLNMKEPDNALGLTENAIIFIESSFYFNSGRIGTPAYKPKPKRGFLEHIQTRIKERSPYLKTMYSPAYPTAVVYYGLSNMEAATSLRNQLSNKSSEYKYRNSGLSVIAMETDQVESESPIAQCYEPKKRLLFDLLGYFRTGGCHSTRVQGLEENVMVELNRMNKPSDNFLLIYFPSRPTEDHPGVLLVPFEGSPFPALDIIATIEVLRKKNPHTPGIHFIHNYVKQQPNSNRTVTNTDYAQILSHLRTTSVFETHQSLVYDYEASDLYTGVPYYALDYYCQVGYYLAKGNTASFYIPYE